MVVQAETPTFPAITSPSLLLLILDLHPLSWHLLSQTPPPASSLPPLPHSEAQPSINKTSTQSLTLDTFINVIMVFLNSHLAGRWGNQVVVYGATAGKSRQLYPPPQGIAGSSKTTANMYAPFGMLGREFEGSLRGMISDEQGRMTADEDGSGRLINEQPAIVSALTKALCYINRVLPESTTASTSEPTETSSRQTIQPRILIINATPSPTSDSAVDTKAPKTGGQMRGGYVGLMNCVFAAQKAKVPIDVLTLPPDYTGSSPPIFLQQASYLTEGIYWRWNGRGGLLQYLHGIYLSPPSLRKTPFSVPPQDAVDFRAVCFCHHDVVDVGFVCSVCLSIFCQPRPSCMMCSTRFPIKSIPTLKALAAGVEPIPIPNTIPPPPLPKKTGGGTNGEGVQTKKRKSDVIVID